MNVPVCDKNTKLNHYENHVTGCNQCTMYGNFFNLKVIAS